MRPPWRSENSGVRMARKSGLVKRLRAGKCNQESKVSSSLRCKLPPAQCMCAYGCSACMLGACCYSMAACCHSALGAVVHGACQSCVAWQAESAVTLLKLLIQVNVRTGIHLNMVCLGP